MENVKRLPYGVSNFVTVATQHRYYVDKTMYLPLLESVADFLFFIRPRRFGKSLFIDMMRCYYDKYMAPRFDELFSGLWIHGHPTPDQGQFQMLCLDFSQVTGSAEELPARFNEYCCICLNDFMRTYRADYSDEVHEEFQATHTATGKLAIIDTAAKRQCHRLYLIIDEYDNFTNVVFNKDGHDPYHAITHAEGFYRGVFKLFKPMFERIFLTGVSPVTLDDLTSGFNIATNISMDPRFNDMLGFTTDDVRQMVTHLKATAQLPQACDVEAIIGDMKPWYDNYCFAVEHAERKVRVFNPDMTLNYLNYYVGHQLPLKDMLDKNTRTDYNKMKRIMALDKEENQTRRGLVRRIAEEGQILGNVEESFPAEKLVKPGMFVSLLFYYGMLTIRGMRGATPILGIPNNNVRKQYYGYLLEQYEAQAGIDLSRLDEAYYEMAFHGRWEQALRYVGEAYKNTSSVRDAVEGERNIQGFFLAYLNLNPYYLTAPEVEVAHGFCDFFLLPDLTHYPTQHSYILELKYLPKKDFAAAAGAQWQEAEAQIARYAAAPRVQKLRQGTRLHRIIMQFEGWELRRLEEV